MFLGSMGKLKGLDDLKGGTLLAGAMDRKI